MFHCNSPRTGRDGEWTDDLHQSDNQIQVLHIKLEKADAHKRSKEYSLSSSRRGIVRSFLGKHVFPPSCPDSSGPATYWRANVTGS